MNNVLLITSDQHSRYVLGCYGNEVVQTPHLDGLAARGTRFDHAYTPNPICVPARACIATGRYTHQLDLWGNGTPYTGTEADSWGHRLREQGFQATTIGKLHFQANRDSGFDERIPMHVKTADEGYIGALLSWVREHIPDVPHVRGQVLEARAGEFGYTHYDRQVAELAEAWLYNEASPETPWALHVSFTYPHFPLIAPQEYVDLYPLDSVPMPINWQEADWADHPVINWARERQHLSDPFTETELRQAIAVYYGMVSYLDDQIGHVLQALETAGFADDTIVIYTSDHGEMLGDHGCWFKCKMYEGSAGVPMIVAGPSVPAGKTSHTNASLIDLYPTIVEEVGASYQPVDKTLPGESLVTLASTEDQNRPILSEFHSVLSPSGIYMLRDARWKYVYYYGYPPQLFDMLNDPDEQQDLANDAQYANVLAECEANLRNMIDIDATEQRVRAFQAAKIAEYGGIEAVRSRQIKHTYTPAPG